LPGHCPGEAPSPIAYPRCLTDTINNKVTQHLGGISIPAAALYSIRTIEAVPRERQASKCLSPAANVAGTSVKRNESVRRVSFKSLGDQGGHRWLSSLAPSTVIIIVPKLHRLRRRSVQLRPVHIRDVHSCSGEAASQTSPHTR
jgi:hypothetical protein